MVKKKVSKKTKKKKKVPTRVSHMLRAGGVSTLTKLPEVKVPDRKANVTGLLSLDMINGILSTCAAFKVLSFQYEGLSVTFNKTLDEPIRNVMQQDEESSGKRRGTVQNLNRPSRADQLEEFNDKVDLELEHLKITDPAAYEEFIQSEDATDGES